jgi:hypothetical protein
VQARRNPPAAGVQLRSGPLACRALERIAAFAAALWLAWLCSCAAPQPASTAPPATQRRQYLAFSFDEPNDPRWVFVPKEQSPSTAFLWRTLNQPAHIFYVRIATSLRDRALRTPAELEAEMKPKLLEVQPPGRLVSGSVAPATRQGQACLRVDRVSERPGASDRPEDRLETSYRGLYCNHPSDPRLGIYMIYSQQARRGELDPALDELGEKFIAGVSIDVRYGVPAH